MLQREVRVGGEEDGQGRGREKKRRNEWGKERIPKASRHHNEYFGRVK
jgi:hypothetical protein